jgi:hypothetical protein
MPRIWTRIAAVVLAATLVTSTCAGLHSASHPDGWRIESGREMEASVSG